MGPTVKMKMGWDGKRVDVDTPILQYLNDIKEQHDAKVTELKTLLEDLGYDKKAEKRQFLKDICSGIRCAVLPLRFLHAR